MQQQTRNRGDELNGGKFVGQVAGSSLWVWYPGSDGTFEAMCERFDAYYGAGR